MAQNILYDYSKLSKTSQREKHNRTPAIYNLEVAPSARLCSLNLQVQQQKPGEEHHLSKVNTTEHSWASGTCLSTTALSTFYMGGAREIEWGAERWVCSKKKKGNSYSILAFHGPRAQAPGCSEQKAPGECQCAQ